MNKVQLRKLHRLLSIWVALPLLIIIVTGITLQLRNNFEYLQPETLKVKNEANAPVLTLEQIIEKMGERKKEIEQIIYRPGKNNVSLRLKDDIEVQINPQTGEIVKEAKRRTSFLIELHQGSFFTKYGQFGIFFSSGIILLFLLISGVILYFPSKRSGNTGAYERF